MRINYNVSIKISKLYFVVDFSASGLRASNGFFSVLAKLGPSAGDTFRGLGVWGSID
jgi:hypothetical protein